MWNEPEVVKEVCTVGTPGPQHELWASCLLYTHRGNVKAVSMLK
jgi:hypothetical protein